MSTIGVNTGIDLKEYRKIEDYKPFLINFIDLLEIRQILITFVRYDIYILKVKPLLRCR